MMIESILSKLSSHRSRIYGVAALLVVLYHTYLMTEYEPLVIFKHGYIGVDLFVMLGGYFCCYSYQKHTLKQFYLNRFLRIYPIWFFVGGVFFIPRLLFLWGDVGAVELGKSIWGITLVLPLWTGKGGCDWFTASILQYYALFPLLWKLIEKVNVYMLFTVVTVACFLCIDLPVYVRWQMDCFISRLPVFLLGMILYHLYKLRQETAWRSYLPFLFVLVLGFTAALSQTHQFFAAAMFSPFLAILLVLVFTFLAGKLTSRWFAPLTFIGDRSLEAYYGGNYYRLAACFQDMPFTGSVVHLIYVFFCMSVYAWVNKFMRKTILANYLK